MLTEILRKKSKRWNRSFPVQVFSESVCSDITRTHASLSAWHYVCMHVYMHLTSVCSSVRLFCPSVCFVHPSALSVLSVSLSCPSVCSVYLFALSVCLFYPSVCSVCSVRLSVLPVRLSVCPWSQERKIGKIASPFRITSLCQHNQY